MNLVKGRCNLFLLRDSARIGHVNYAKLAWRRMAHLYTGCTIVNCLAKISSVERVKEETTAPWPSAFDANESQSLIM